VSPMSYSVCLKVKFKIYASRSLKNLTAESTSIISKGTCTVVGHALNYACCISIIICDRILSHSTYVC
jgi:hypothetical protein